HGDPLPTRHHVLPQRHRTHLGDHHGSVPAHLGEPVAELLGVGHCRRQGDQVHVLGQVQDDLLPHRPTEPVGEVVHLVHHHIAQAPQRGRGAVQHVPQHLGGHHHHRRLTVDGHV